MTIDNFLSINDVFSSLDQRHLDQLKEKFTQRFLAPGEILFREGDPGDCMYILTKGSLEVLQKDDKGNAIKLADRGVGSLIGMTSLFYESNVRSATLRATLACEVWCLSQECFRQAMVARGDLAFNFIAYLSRELRAETDKRVDLLAGKDVSEFKLLVFDAKKYERGPFEKYRPDGVDIHYIDSRLNSESVSMAGHASAVCAFVNDQLDRAVLTRLAAYGVGLVALRCAGFNNVDLAAAQELGICVTRVPAYSPYAVAEHALAMMMTLNRKTHRAYNRVREGNFYLNRLVGFDMHGRTAGVVGTGKIGKCLINILHGMGMKVLGWDAFPDTDFAMRSGMEYVSLDELLTRADVISLHVPLLPETHHLINAEAFAKMKAGAMIINTSRGGLIDTKALIGALKTRHIGAAGLDVYEEEEHYFFSDHSGQIIDDDTLARLISFPNVLVTSHQAFLTEDALDNIAQTTLESITEYRDGKRYGELTYRIAPS